MTSFNDSRELGDRHAAPRRAAPLSAQEDWLRLAVTTPGGLPSGLQAARERYGEGVPLRHPPSGTVVDRLSIHARGYLWRLLGCLESDYPAVRALLGEAVFKQFSLAYLAACPPVHYSLFELGASFADHMQRTRPPDSAVPEGRRSFLDLPIDLARAERARLECSRAVGPEGAASGPGPRRAAHPSDPPDEGSGHAPEEPSMLELLAGDREIETAGSVRLLSLSHDVRGFLAAVDSRGRTGALGGGEGGAPLPKVPARKVLLAVSRVAYRPVLTELDPWQYDLLTRARKRATIAELAHGPAPDEGAPISADGGSATLADLALWLPAARALGMMDYKLPPYKGGIPQRPASRRFHGSLFSSGTKRSP